MNPPHSFAWQLRASRELQSRELHFGVRLVHTVVLGAKRDPGRLRTEFRAIFQNGVLLFASQKRRPKSRFIFKSTLLEFGMAYL